MVATPQAARAEPAVIAPASPVVDRFAGTRAGQEMTNGIGMVLCWCPPGKFVMGSPHGELGRGANEDQVKVELTSGFWLGKFAVTQGEYEAVVGSNPTLFRRGQDLPVEFVSWDGATEFCRRLTERERGAGKLTEGWRYRLPTEAEWEYACRAGTTTALNSGQDLTSSTAQCGNLDEVGWYFHNSGGSTHRVGMKCANAWGMHDLLGNLREWCADWYGEPLEGGRDPRGASSGSSRISRGGCWYDNAGNCRSASRYSSTPAFGDCTLGFRVALGSVR